MVLVYEKLKDQIETESWKPTDEEEFEDSEGNVLTRKVHRRLAPCGSMVE